MSETKRVEWVDRFKGIGMLLVMLGHTPFHWVPVQWIYTFHIPLFFFASGLFFDPDKHATWRSWWSSRSKTLVVPFLFFGAVDFLFLLATGYFGQSAAHGPTPLQAVGGFALGVRDSSAIHGTLWFVSCLFCLEALYFAVCKSVKSASNRSIAAAICGLTGIVVTSERFIRFPYSLDLALLCIPFLWAGREFRRRESRFDQWNAHWWFAPAVLLLSLLLFKPSAPNLYYGRIGVDWLFHARAAIGILAMIAVAKRLPDIPLFTHMGRQSLVYLALHQLIVFWLVGHALGFVPFGQNTAGTMLRSLALVFGSIALIAPLSWLLTKYAPRLVGRKPA